MKTEIAILLSCSAACAHQPSDPRGEELAHLGSRPEVTPGGWLPSAIGDRSSTATSALDAEFFDHIEEDEPMLNSAMKVKPILAVTGTIVTFDIPMAEDERIDQWVAYLTGRGRVWYEKWLSRSTRYVPLFWQILEQYEMPRDLIFLSMIESGFSPSAYSWAHAAGAWQFIPGTARDYGLHVGFWLDERRDFELATHAAARYLKRLYEYFDNDWYLAWAAYNAGVGKVQRAIDRMKTRDFWRLSRSRNLRRETSHYVPKLLAAAKIAKQPSLYGFDDVRYLPPLRWEVLTVTIATDLKTVSKACGLQDPAEILMLNPALRAEVTPPGRDYSLRVPVGRKRTCETGLRSIPMSQRVTYRYCELKPKDTLAGIAAKFQTTREAILEYNKIKEERFGDLDELIIPVPFLKAGQVPIVEPPAKRHRPGRYSPDELQVIVYRVRSGDSLWKIARRYQVSLKKLRLWNGLWKKSPLRIGQKLRVYIGQGRAPS